MCVFLCVCVEVGGFTEGRALFLDSYFIELTSCLLVQIHSMC